MTPEKVLEVICVYREFFEVQEIPKVKLSEEQFDEISFESDEDTMLAHCHGMLDDMEEFVKEGRMEKCFRWFGFIQGVLWSSGNFSLNELKNHNRP